MFALPCLVTKSGRATSSATVSSSPRGTGAGGDGGGGDFGLLRLGAGGVGGWCGDLSRPVEMCVCVCVCVCVCTPNATSKASEVPQCCRQPIFQRRLLTITLIFAKIPNTQVAYVLGQLCVFMPLPTLSCIQLCTSVHLYMCVCVQQHHIIEEGVHGSIYGLATGVRALVIALAPLKRCVPNRLGNS